MLGCYGAGPREIWLVLKYASFSGVFLVLRMVTDCGHYMEIPDSVDHPAQVLLVKHSK